MKCTVGLDVVGEKVRWPFDVCNNGVEKCVISGYRKGVARLKEILRQRLATTVSMVLAQCSVYRMQRMTQVTACVTVELSLSMHRGVATGGDAGDASPSCPSAIPLVPSQASPSCPLN